MSYSDSLDAICPERVLNAWLDAITSLRLNYCQLSACIKDSYRGSTTSKESKTDLSQCPTKQLVILQTRMELALKQLLEEINQVENEEQSTSKEQLKKLESHTLRLNRLNQQAQTRFHLLTQSSS